MNILKNTIICTIYFLCIYPFALNATSIGSRTAIAMVGCCIFTLQVLYNKPNPFAPITKISFFITLFCIISFFSAVYNNTLDFEFVRLGISIYIMIFSGYFILWLTKILQNDISIESVTKYIVSATVIHISFSLLMLFSPEIKDFVFTNISASENKLEAMRRLEHERLIGFSRSFFAAGIYYGLTLILIGNHIRNNKLSKIELLCLTTVFIFIFITGTMTARTTLVGALIGILMIIVPSFGNSSFSISKYYLKRILFTSGISISLLAIIILFTFISDSQRFITIYNFAFEIFINYIENKEFRTDSTDVLKDMFVYPNELKTWIIGDGIWDIGEKYYMGTDVGYLRMIFYFGIIGTFFFLLFQIALVTKSTGFNFFSTCLISYILILNIKGFTEISCVMVLFFFAKFYKHKLL